jgi:preprotein translocase subunit YajC
VKTLFDLAYAMGTSGGGTGGGGGGAITFVPLILMFAIFYFLLIRPQQRKQKMHRQMLSSLKKGDAVITNGGLYGKITGITDTYVTLEIADRVRVKVGRSFVTGVTTEQPPVSDSTKSEK